jgi:hypothetical protein
LNTPARLGLFGGAIVAVVGVLSLYSTSGGHEPRDTAGDDRPLEPSAADEVRPESTATHAPIAAVVDASAPFDEERSSEEQLTSRAKDVLSRQPAEALRLVAAADRRFGTASETRRLIEIRALVGLGQIAESHVKAEAFYRQFPDSPEGERIERLTGAHPRPWGPNSR